MHQNRVDPWGNLHAVSHRGQWFGNKGCLHDAHGLVRRAHVGKRWIVCATAFRGRHRDAMPPGRYTGLFFKDEATAYAAGHRPCAECRHADWRQFSQLWQGLFGPANANAIDAVLHAARLDGRARRLHVMPAADVPIGAMIVVDNEPVLRAAKGWWRWNFARYCAVDAPVGGRSAVPFARPVEVLTPSPVVTMLQAGLGVQIAPVLGCN